MKLLRGPADGRLGLVRDRAASRRVTWALLEQDSQEGDSQTNSHEWKGQQAREMTAIHVHIDDRAELSCCG